MQHVSFNKTVDSNKRVCYYDEINVMTEETVGVCDESNCAALDCSREIANSEIAGCKCDQTIMEKDRD